MKKQLLSLIVLVVVLCLTACTANKNQVSKPTSPENLGYSISQEKISQTVLEDSEFFNQETFYHPDLYGDFIVVGAYWHDYLGDELYPVAFLQAVPANTTKIKLPFGEISASDWEQYRIFKD